jgi:hypothetical protein
MKRSGFQPKPDWKPLQRKTPLKPSSKPMLKSSIDTKVASGKLGGKLIRAGIFKSRAPKMTPIRRSAKGEDCTLRLPGICKPEPGNVVWAHSNDSRHGKGFGLKADDQFGCYACYWCHRVLDGQAPRPARLSEADLEQAFERAMRESREILRRKKLLEPPHVDKDATTEPAHLGNPQNPD